MPEQLQSILPQKSEAGLQGQSADALQFDRPRVLLVAPSLRIMGGQAVSADRLLRGMRADGVAIDFQPINPKPPGGLQWTERVKVLRTLVVSSFYIAALLRRIPRYDIVHVFSASYLSFIISQVPAILIAGLYRKPLILNYRSGEADDHLHRWGRFIRPFLRLPCLIVVQSEYLVDVFRKHGYDAVPIPNVADLETFTYRHRASARPRILVARSLEPLYNVACALRAFRRVQRRFPQAHLTILGDGSQRRKLEQMSQGLDLHNVIFAGRVERSAIRKYYDEHDIFLNSSSIDNTPVSILEALAAGLPVVTTRAGGIPWIVKDGVNGRLVDLDDDATMAKRVIELLEDPSQVSKLSQAGHREAMKYSWRRVADQWYEVYATVAHQRERTCRSPGHCRSLAS